MWSCRTSHYKTWVGKPKWPGTARHRGWKPRRRNQLRSWEVPEYRALDIARESGRHRSSNPKYVPRPIAH